MKSFINFSEMVLINNFFYINRQKFIIKSYNNRKFQINLKSADKNDLLLKIFIAEIFYLHGLYLRFRLSTNYSFQEYTNEGPVLTQRFV